MEFFESLDTLLVEQDLQQISLSHLADYCASIDEVLECKGDTGRIRCLWGDSAIHRELINGGVRFSLPSCPNNLAWTITMGTEPGPAYIVIHLTISRQHQDLDFIDSIHTFIADWKRSLENRSRITGVFTDFEKVVCSE